MLVKNGGACFEKLVSKVSEAVVMGSGGGRCCQPLSRRYSATCIPIQWGSNDHAKKWSQLHISPVIVIIKNVGSGIRMHTTPGIMIIKNVGLGIRMHTTPWTMIIEAGGFKGGPQGPLVSDAASATSQPPAGYAHRQACGSLTGLTTA